MLILGLVWMGAAFLSGREVVVFLREQGPDGAPSPEPAPTPDDTPDEARASDIRTLREPSTQSEEEELRSSNRTLGLAAGGAVAAGFGALVHPALPLLGVPLLIAGIVPAARRAWRESRAKKQLSYAGLEIVQAVSELALGQVFLTAGGWLLYAGGKRLLIATRRDARDALIASVTHAAMGAWVERDGVEVLTPLDQIQIGDRVVVRGGDQILVDGRVVQGVLGVDQRALTGESGLAELTTGDAAHAGTTVLSGEAVLVAERTGRETVMARVEALLASATSYEQQLTTRVTRVTERSVRPTLALAAFGLLTRGPIGIIGGFWTNSLDMAWMSAPYSMLNTIRAANRSGILIKDGRSLELVSKVDTVIFDKTGTLTLDRLTVAAVRSTGAFTEDDLLRLAAAIEQYQSHPIARAIVDATRHDPRPLPPTEGRRLEIGHGVRGRAGGHELLIGSVRMFALEGLEVPAWLGELEGAAAVRGHSTIYVAVDGRCAGAVELAPQIRAEARAVVDRLRARGLAVMILSGDDEGPTRALAEALGVERFVARALPEAKMAAIEALKSEGHVVCFVGDGINDVLAMHHANVSVSVAGAASLAMESAQVVLGSGLDGLVALFEIGADFSADQRLIMNSALATTTVSAAGFIVAGFGLPALVGIYSLGVGISVFSAMRPGFRDYDDTAAS
jgi:Cu2+-exporting ATPase